MADRHAELLAMLRTLRLPAVADTFADLALNAAKANLTHEAFLYEVGLPHLHGQGSARRRDRTTTTIPPRR